MRKNLLTILLVISALCGPVAYKLYLTHGSEWVSESGETLWPACADNKPATVLELVERNSNLPSHIDANTEAVRVRELNRLKSDIVPAGVCINVKVYRKEYRWVKYQLKPGEDPHKVAVNLDKPFYKSPDDVVTMILQENGIDVDKAKNLKIGQEIKVPEWKK